METAGLLGDYKQWRWMFIVGAVPALLAVLVRRRLKEPEKWKAISEGRVPGQQLGSITELFGNPVLRRNAFIGLGLAVPGVVRRADGLVHFAPNLGWRDVPLGRLVAERLHSSLPILIANDADLGALAEHTWGAGIGVDHLIFLSGDVGVGGGLIIDGRPLVGAAGCAGEVGHVQVNPEGVLCRCGAIGCWETEIGGPALLRRTGRVDKSYRPEAVTRLLRLASSGDRQALAAVEDFGRWLGVGISGLVNAFNPQRVVLGGFLGTMWPLVERVVDEELFVRVMAPSLEAVEILPAQLADAPLLGAAELALTRVLDEPTLVPILAAERRTA